MNKMIKLLGAVVLGVMLQNTLEAGPQFWLRNLSGKEVKVKLFGIAKLPIQTFKLDAKHEPYHVQSKFIPAEYVAWMHVYYAQVSTDDGATWGELQKIRDDIGFCKPGTGDIIFDVNADERRLDSSGVCQKYLRIEIKYEPVTLWRVAKERAKQREDYYEKLR